MNAEAASNSFEALQESRQSLRQFTSSIQKDQSAMETRSSRLADPKDDGGDIWPLEPNDPIVMATAMKQSQLNSCRLKR